MMHRFEHRHQPLASRRIFMRRVRRYLGLSLAIIGVSLMIGVLGYHFTEGLPWLDALVNASMILGGMGPVDPVRSVAGKWFASFYALFSGMVLLVAVGVLIAPIFHRFLHRFHLEIDEER
jgi:FtsH-binding integral membrane protein